MKSLQIYLNEEPVAKGRPRFRTTQLADGKIIGTAYTPAKTKRYEKQVSKAAAEAMIAQGWQFAEKGTPLVVLMIFYIEIPQSWSKKKKKEMEGVYCTKNVDTDNLVKGILDGINSAAVWHDDCQVVHLTATKRWSQCPGVVVEINGALN